MPFTIEKKPPPPRAAILLTPAPLAGWEAPYDQVAPGLYPDETAVRLDSGELVAISVAAGRQANGGGMVYLGWVRAIAEDGQTLRDGAGQELELEFRHPMDAGVLSALETPTERGDDRVKREIMLMMLGEPPTMRPIPVDPAVAANPPAVPDGHFQDPAAGFAPVIDWAADVRLNASIRHAIALADSARAEPDVAALLSAP